MSTSSAIGPNRPGASAVIPGGGVSLVIQAARASPIASEDEKPEPLHPLALESRRMIAVARR